MKYILRKDMVALAVDHGQTVDCLCSNPSSSVGLGRLRLVVYQTIHH